MTDPTKIALLTREEIEDIIRRVVREELGTPAPPAVAPAPVKALTDEDLAAARKQLGKYGRGGAR